MIHRMNLSLYSTVQKRERWGLGMVKTNMLVSKNQRQALFTQRQALQTQREPCAPNLRLGLHWPCRFHVVCVNFIGVGQPTRTQFPVEYGLWGPPLITYASGGGGGQH